MAKLHSSVALPSPVTGTTITEHPAMSPFLYARRGARRSAACDLLGCPEGGASVIVGLDGFESTKGGIRFTDGRRLPDNAYEALVSLRRDEIDAALTKPAGPA
jgi:hypothetical protein